MVSLTVCFSHICCLNVTVYSQFVLFSEFHIRVPLWAQWFLHKHSLDKDLQNEVWARRVWSLLFRRTRDHGLHRVRLKFWLVLCLLALRVAVQCLTRSVFSGARSTGVRARTSHWKLLRRNRNIRDVAQWGRSPRRSPMIHFSISSLHLKVETLKSTTSLTVIHTEVCWH